jgi:hypothetical protein
VTTKTHPGHLLTNAVIEVLRSTGLTVGDGERPLRQLDGPITTGWTGTPGQSPFLPYVVVHPMAGGSTDGGLVTPNDDTWPRYSITSYGGDRYSCELIATKARAALLDGTYVVPARRVRCVKVDWNGGAERADDVQPPEWNSPERFLFFSTPA